MTLPGSEIMISCRQVSHLLSERRERLLNLRERVGLRLHLLICGECRRFARQIDWIQRVLARARSDDQCAIQRSMPDATRERIAQALRDRLKQNNK